MHHVSNVTPDLLSHSNVLGSTVVLLLIMTDNIEQFPAMHDITTC